MDLFEEIREDIVKSKYTHLWNKYAKFALMGMVLFVVFLVVYFVRYEHINNLNIDGTEKIYQVVQDGMNQDDQFFLSSIDEFIDDIPVNHRAYIILQRVNYEIKNNNVSRAYELLLDLYNDELLYKPYGDFAELLLNYIVFKYPTDDKFDRNVIENITVGNIFYNIILEIRALCYLEQNKILKAKNELRKILNEPNVSQDSKGFAVKLLNLLESKAQIS